jgi:uncharacterized protein (DUF927 family)
MSDILTPVDDRSCPPPQSDAITATSLQELMDAIPSVPFEFIAGLALDHFEDVIDILGLEGEYRGKEYVAYNPRRNDSDLGSFSINSQTGVFADFAVDNCAGGDLIALGGHVWDCSMTEAAKRLVDELAKLEAEHSATRQRSVFHRPTQVARQFAAGSVVQPVPADVPAPDLSSFVCRGERLAARYAYTDLDGRLCFYVLRLVLQDGSKLFRPIGYLRAPDGTWSWSAKMPAGLRPLFNLLSLKDATDSTTVFVVEGEKAAQALQKILPDSPVLTSANGAKSTSKSDWSPLAGRDVVIWPDNDDAGLKYQQDVIELIRAVEPATPIAVVNVEGLLRAICGMKGWIYDDKQADLKGWDAADVALLGLDTAVITEALEQVTEELPIDGQAVAVDDTSDEAAFPGVRWESGNEYRLAANVVQMRKTNKEGKSYWGNVCSRVDIVRQLRDDNGTGWSLQLVIHTPDGSSNTVILPRSQLSDAQKLKAELQDKGVIAYNWNDLQGYLSHAIPTTTHKLVRSVGWHGGLYVQSTRIYGTGTEPLALESSTPACTDFAQRGDLDMWNAEVGERCRGNSRLMLAVCAALAGPLLRLVNVESGGIHLVGPSSVGKTTALRVAASVWGSPNDFIRSWRSTSNGLESVAAGLNDSVLLIDEMNQATPQEAGDAVYMLGNGQGKIRMTRYGTGARLLQWRLVFISTGEIPLQQHLESAGKSVRAGMEVRLLNVPANAGCDYGMFDTLHMFDTSKALADHLQTSTGQAYGVAGDRWLTYLAEQIAEHGQEAFCGKMRDRMAEIESQYSRQNADGQVNRAARRFALLALAGEMAANAGIGGWGVSDPTAMMQTCFDAWIAERGGVGSSEETQALRQVQHFFEQHGQSSFQRIDSSTITSGEALTEYRTIFQRAGYYRPSADEFYVLPEPFRTRVCAGLNWKLVAQVLHNRGLLVAEGSSTVRVPGLPNSIRAYRISGRIVGFDPTGVPSTSPGPCISDGQ